MEDGARLLQTVATYYGRWTTLGRAGIDAGRDLKKNSISICESNFRFHMYIHIGKHRGLFCWKTESKFSEFKRSYVSYKFGTLLRPFK